MKLVGRQHDIASGRSGLSAYKVAKYREQFATLGFELPALDVKNVIRNAVRANQHRELVGTAKASVSCCGGAKAKSSGVIASAFNRLQSLKNAAVDFLRDGMHVASDEQQQYRLAICADCPIVNEGWCDSAKGGCGCNLSLKVMARAAYCPQGKWFAHTDNYRPLVNPTRSLMFHMYPKRGAEFNWHWHLEQIRKHQDKFNGKIIIAVGVDSGTATIDEVQRQAEGIRVTKWIKADNTKALAETHTHVAMMAEVETADPNAIVFRYHTKGVTKTPDAVEQRWAELLWQVNTDLTSVEDALASHMTCGAMRSLKPLVSKKPGDFFFAGSAYWFRAADAFARDWKHTEGNRWWVEYVPCHLFNRHESASLLYDQTESSVIRSDHFATYIQPEWDQWKSARGL